MKTMHSSFLATVMSVGSLLFSVGCAGEDPNSGKAQGQVTGQKSCAEDEEEANDKITCTVDTDCDADEYCSNGLCTGLDGEDEDDECEADDDDEGGADKITCSVDADCDADEYCSNGLCTGLDGEDDDGDAEEPDDKITCSTNADCDADEVCTSGLCT